MRHLRIAGGASVAAEPLSPAERALEHAMIEGFFDRHHALAHRLETISLERHNLEAFGQFTGRPAWLWTAPQMDAYSRSLRKIGYARATMRAKQAVVKRFLEYLTHPAYDWSDRCYALTGLRPRQICTAENTRRHQRGAATSKRRRPTDLELAAIERTIIKAIKAADAEGKGGLARRTHLAIFRFQCAFGARNNEVVHTDLADVAAVSSAAVARFSEIEDVTIRFGKSHDGGDPKVRTVPVCVIFRKELADIAHYIRETRPLLVCEGSPDALFLNERGERFRADTISAIFREYRRAAAVHDDITAHCLRHYYNTKLAEHRVSVATRKKLLGHEHEQTTALYEHLSDEDVKRELQRVQAHEDDEYRRRYGWWWKERNGRADRQRGASPRPRNTSRSPRGTSKRPRGRTTES